MPASRYLFGTLPWYSVLIVSGMALAILLADREEKRLGLPEDTIMDLALRLLPAGVLGARLYYVLFSLEEYLKSPLEILAIWHGGLAIYGGILGGLAALILFARRRKLNVFLLMDTVIPGVALAQAIGRWGNFFNMEAYGPLISAPGLQFFPVSVQIPGPDGVEWHLATFFLASVGDALIFLILWLRRKRVQRHGEQFALYLLLYGSGRMLLEQFRQDSLMSFSGSLRVSQILSLILILTATTFLLFPFRSGKIYCKRKTGFHLLCNGLLLCLMFVAGGKQNAGIPFMLCYGTSAVYFALLPVLFRAFPVSGMKTLRLLYAVFICLHLSALFLVPVFLRVPAVFACLAALLSCSGLMILRAKKGVNCAYEPNA